ncbi:cbb3-type cytochrome c oxidase subunit I [Fodinibius salsisoli]|uniref:Cbb3-type cytochrome c oxidase subunit I n=1 Tax=Fodinibius salsisoli TaxID=2820877 RepID=A0ABT3PNB5_9BACT|nr:cbb3-type cytochrome c oxidase subunit I [Fodinibius salsisoli]MCW9707303.1 cbb3-type cytochrome c oxidase subunit I [Fodinibius salsisoli]
MPAPSRWMIRCSLLYLLTGFAIGAAMLISKAYPVYPQVWQLLPVHIEIAIFGWIIQFTMGTAYWILPRYLKTGGRGNSMLAKSMVVLFNTGILLNVISYLQFLPEEAVFWGRLSEVGAVGLFVILHWNRVVSYRR